MHDYRKGVKMRWCSSTNKITQPIISSVDTSKHTDESLNSVKMKRFDSCIPPGFLMELHLCNYP